METKQNIVAAIDIGTTKIAAIIGKKNASGKIEIIGYGSAKSTGLKRGVVLKIEQTVDAISDAISEAEAMAKVKITDAYVGIAGYNIRSAHNRGYISRDVYDNPINQTDVDKLINDMQKMPVGMNEEILHVLPQDFIVDNENIEKDPRGMFGKKLEANFHIVISNKATAMNIRKCVERAGIRVKELVLEPLASATSVLTEDEKEMGVALVDIGGGTTDVAVFYDGIIRHTAVIPFGGNVVTQDIREGCNILDRYAERLKEEFGSAIIEKKNENKVVNIPGINGKSSKEISFKNLSEIIKARMEEIIEEVIFQIESSGMFPQLGAGIVLTGGGSLLSNLTQLVAFKTGADVRLGLPTQGIESSVIKAINKPSYSTAIGLMVMGIEKGENCCNEVIVEEVKEVKEEIKTEKKESEVIKSTKQKKKLSFLEKLGGFFEVDDEKM